MKVGAAQFASECGDVDANTEIHLDWIARGRREKLNLLVMPEMSLAGHSGSDNLLLAAMTCSDPRLIRLAEEAADMTVVVGFIEEGLAAQFYNTAAMLKDGKVVHLHRKVNLANYGKLDEGKHFAAGRFVETYALDKNWLTGLLICSDLWNPALTHLAFLHGATLMITPVSSGIEAVPPEFDNPSGWTLAIRFYSMYLSGVISEDGVVDGSLAGRSERLVPEERTWSFLLHDGSQRIVVTQNDVRQIQLAKAALYAGVKLLLDRAGIEKVDRIRLAGAFGSHIDPQYAMVLGLIPDCELDKVESAGNAAGTGARIALLNVATRSEIECLVRRIEKIETAVEPKFQEYFVNAMAIPHKVDRFPELAKVLIMPKPTKVQGSIRRRRGENRRP